MYIPVSAEELMSKKKNVKRKSKLSKNLIRLIGQTKFKSRALSSIDLIFFVFTSSCFEKLLRNIQRADIGGPGGEGATPLILGKERSQRGEKSS